VAIAIELRRFSIELYETDTSDVILAHKSFLLAVRVEVKKVSDDLDGSI